MKALTLTQPWATLVAIGAKRIETRGWRTPYTGPLAIHAAKGFPRWAKEFALSDLVISALKRCSLSKTYSLETSYPRGCVVATCNLKACVPTEVLDPGDTVFSVSVQALSDEELQFGDFSKGRWGWLLEDVKALPAVVPAKGSLGLWDWDEIAAKATI